MLYDITEQDILNRLEREKELRAREESARREKVVKKRKKFRILKKLFKKKC